VTRQEAAGRPATPKPGTPMIGDYSANQMDDFYAALAAGQVKPTGVMNYVQHLHIAERCPPAARVVDVCCGRGLQLPVLYRYAPHIACYVGLDISPANLREAADRVAELDRRYGRQFELSLVEWDVAEPWPQLEPFDVAVYTSALEHLPRDRGVGSLRNTAAGLAADGRMYLSTPNTPGDPPRVPQYGVHVYEWHAEELSTVLTDCGMVVEDLIGLLPPKPADLAAAVRARYGDGAAHWYERLRETMPAAFLGTLSACAVPEVATELLYVCRRRPG
jgi:SAM-dependent methyltransferase